MVGSKQKYWLYGILILTIIGAILISGCVQNSPKTTNGSDKTQSAEQIDFSNLPRFVHHNFIELDKIAKISKFRSGVGHDFSRGNNEANSCRSMKHYFEPVGINDMFWSRFHEGNISKSDWPIVKYFAPVTGTIVDMCPSKNMFGDNENQFIIQSKEYPNICFDFFHVLAKEDIQMSSEVEAGEFLGIISPGNSGEIAVSINPNSNEQLVSFFEVIDDNAFSEYETRGVKSRQDFIISKDERDKKPLQCDDKEPRRFIGNWFTSDKNEYDNWSMGPDNWVFLKENQKPQSEKNYSKLFVLYNLLPELYDNTSIMLMGDTIMESGEQLIIKNSRIDLNNHSLIFREGSRGEIRNSIILNASEEYWDGYVSRHPEEMESIMQSEKGWGVKPSAGLGIETDNFTLDNSVIKNSHSHGIYFYYARNSSITNCRFINNAWAALRSEGSWGIYFVNNTLEGNAWENPSRVGFGQVDVDAGGNMTFSHNKISSMSVTEGAVAFYGQKGIIIKNNEFDDIILLDKCINCTIRYNSAKELDLFGCENVNKEDNSIGRIYETASSGPEAWQEV